MSNEILGNIYLQIIDNVIKGARKQFQEEGYTDEVLEDLKLEWQKNTSAYKVGTMPWDPQLPSLSAYQEQQQHHNNNNNNQQKLQPNPAHVKVEPPQPNPARTVDENIKSSQNDYDTHIKPEPSYDQSMYGYATMSSYSSSSAINPMAGQRAANLLHQQFGPQASASLRAAGLPQQPRPIAQHAQHVQYSYPTAASSHSNSPIPSPAPYTAPSQVTPVQPSNPADPSIKQSQTDGSASVPSQQSRDQIVQMGGKIAAGDRATADQNPPSQMLQKNAQFDGADFGDIIGDDEDAINSDLDDPEENIDAEHDETEGYQDYKMLCLHDKVTRVKNKWKVNVKDGVLACDGKEYLFSKGSGELEW